MTRSQLVFGVAFIVVGTVLLLDRADVLDASRVIADWWPTVIILVGLTRLVMRPRNIAIGVFVTAMGAALLLWSAWDVDTVRLLWPLILIGIGIWFLTRRPSTPSSPNVVTDREILALFDDRTVRAPAGDLASRSITTIFGDLDYDLRDAHLPGDAVLQIVTIFGDVQLAVPDTWRVTVSGPQIFGEVDVRGGPGSDDTGDGLHLDVVAVFGDITVRRPASAEGAATSARS